MKKVLMLALVIVLVMGLALGMSACTEKKLIGFDTELAEAVAKDLGLKVKFQEINWDTKDQELNAKRIDLIWNGMSMIPERFEVFEFSTPYMDNKQVVVIRKSDQAKYTTIDSLATGKLVAEAGSTGEKYIKGSAVLKDSTYNAAASMITAFTELTAGTSDVAILDSVMAYVSIDENANYKDKLMVVETIDLDTEIPYGIGMRLGSKGLADKINVSLAKMWTNGTIASLGEKYGLTDYLLDCSGYVSVFDSLSAAEKADWEDIQKKGTLIVGYTLFAPIAYYE